MKYYPTINRSVLLVVPKQAFLDWSNDLFPDMAKIHASEIQEFNSYLLEDELFLNDPKKELAAHWKDIFQNELFGQCTDERTHPKLSWELFCEWFDFYRSSIVTDLTDQILELQD